MLQVVFSLCLLIAAMCDSNDLWNAYEALSFLNVMDLHTSNSTRFHICCCLSLSDNLPWHHRCTNGCMLYNLPIVLFFTSENDSSNYIALLKSNQSQCPSLSTCN